MTVDKKMRHEIVPEHRVLTAEEAEEVLGKANIKKELLPKISLNDPIAQQIEAKLGDVIEIKRRSETAGYVFVYRHAIKL